MQLHDLQGKRLYLNEAERIRFKDRASQAPREVRTFCNTLLYTGCRISEALELIPERVDFEDGRLIFRSLKKRGDKIKFRAVPVPPALLDELNLVHGLKDGKTAPQVRIWSWSRATAWRRVKEVFKMAEIEGAHANPKGLRHSYGVHAITKQIPLNKLRDWMGHEDMETTAIYANAIGTEV